MTNLEDYIALVTGGSSGIGFEMTKQLLTQGATVIITARHKDRLEEARRSLSKYGNVYAVSMDVTDEISVKKVAEWVNGCFSHLDMVISNAGIGDNAKNMTGVPKEHIFYDVPLSAVKEVVDTNFVGFFIVSKEFVPIMEKQRKGSLVYVSTSTSTITRFGQVPYGPSKAAGEALAYIMAEELKPKGIAVNIICPGGFTDTPMAGKGVKEFMIKNNRRILEPTILNKTISFLASKESTGISGEKLIGTEIDKWLCDREIDYSFL